jgi:hypothetical protein
METYEDEIDSRVQKERDAVGRRYIWLSGAFAAFYLGARLLHWLLNFPSMTDVNGWSIGLGIWMIVYFAGGYIEMLISEFRLRFKQIDQKATSFQQQLTELSNAINANRPISPKEEREEEALIARYRAAAENGEAWAQHNLGITYYNGKHLPKDNEQAAFWYRKAAEQWDIPSMHFLADLLAGGHGIEPDYSEAIRLYKLVADAGHTYSAMAEYRLGEMYAEGKGTTRDYLEANKWWKESARHGWNSASYQLGELYEAGGGDIAQDFEEAYFWYYVGCGDEDRKELMNYRTKHRDTMAKRLNPERRRYVQERAQQWLEGNRSAVE